MKTRLVPVLALAATLGPLSVFAERAAPARADLSMTLVDGSELKALPNQDSFSINPRLAGVIEVRWERDQEDRPFQGPGSGRLDLSQW